jgi:predicted ABC-type ATPase
MILLYQNRVHFAPEREAVQAGKLTLRQIDKLVRQGESFCLETTLEDLMLASRILTRYTKI